MTPAQTSLLISILRSFNSRLYLQEADNEGWSGQDQHTANMIEELEQELQPEAETI